MRFLRRSLALLTMPAALAAQQGPPKPICTTPAHHAFDFWLGDWDVADTAGTIIARSTITSRAAGCAVMEHWQPTGQPDGVSINWLEPTDGKWHQQWVGGGGWIAAFVGDVKDGVMTIDGTAPIRTPKGEIWSRMTYEKLPNGHVRQRVWNSTDKGATWTVSFAGDYRPRG